LAARKKKKKKQMHGQMSGLGKDGEGEGGRETMTRSETQPVKRKRGKVGWSWKGRDGGHKTMSCTARGLPAMSRCWGMVAFLGGEEKIGVPDEGGTNEGGRPWASGKKKKHT